MLGASLGDACVPVHLRIRSFIDQLAPSPLAALGQPQPCRSPPTPGAVCWGAKQQDTVCPPAGSSFWGLQGV